jgi:glycosyltransferase involved in cell wall biosynthesis
MGELAVFDGRPRSVNVIAVTEVVMGRLSGAAFTELILTIPEVMKALSVCVLPSLKNEATSQVLPQAMLVGTPVVCSSAGGLTEVVEEGVRGRVVPPGDVEALAAALWAVFDKPEQTAQMAIAARDFALGELTFSRQIERTEAVYRSLL